MSVSRVAAVEPLLHGELSVRLEDGTRLVCSRRFRPRLEETVPFPS